jgi:hypothetical protein
MLEDDEPYHGSFVTLRPHGIGFAVAIEPALVDELDSSRTFACKSQAWGHARDLWCKHRLPFRDFSDS